jgi:DNA-directed RNA polymerase specialized sigma24 family protein
MDSSEFTFERFYMVFRPIITMTVKRSVGRMGGVADVEDIVQDIFTMALENWRRISTMANPVAYLAVAAQRLARRASQKIYRELPVQDLPGILQMLGEHESEASVPAMTRAEIRYLLAALTSRQAKIIILGSYGYSDWEIARMLGIAQATVRSHRRNAQNLARRLARGPSQPVEAALAS